MKKLCIVLMCAIMTISLYGCGGKGDSKKEDSKTESKSNWPEDGLAKMLPKPDTSSSKVSINDDDELLVYVKNITKSDFKKYVDETKDKGFNIESEEKSDKYHSFNKDGYNLELTYFEGTKEYWIDLKAPIKLGKLEWPSSELSNMIPKPKFDKGKSEIDTSYRLLLYLGDITKDEYQEYVEECRSKGFNVDYDKGDYYYRAKNKDGYRISLKYEGFKIISVDIEQPEKDDKKDDNKKSEPKTEQPAKKENTDNSKKEKPASNKGSGAVGVSSKFKEAMDSYEAFFDEYVSFMNKYSSSSDPTSMMSDYTNYMTKYADTMKKMGEIDSSKLSYADSLYYLKVQGRITKKLLSVTTK